MRFPFISLSKKAFAVSTILMVVSCGGLYTNYSEDIPDPIDRPGQLSRKDYIDQLVPVPAEKELKIETKQPAIPNASEILLTPPKPKIGVNKTVTLSVTEDVPLKDVFLELARLADIDIEIDPSITGGVIFKSKNRPFDEVVERITDLAGLRYSVNNGVLRIERDKPYIENYQVDFLNIVRSNTGTIQVNTKVLSASAGSSSSGDSGSSSGSSGSSGGSSGGGGSDSLSTGSTSSITSQYDGDLWGAVEGSIKAIVNSSNGGVAAQSSASADPASTAAPATTPTGDPAPFVSINRQAGMITVLANAKTQQKITEYLGKVKEFASAQVLIEAKIVEVALDDRFQSGIDWNLINLKGGIDIKINPTAATDGSADGLTPAAIFDVSRNGGDINAAVSLAQKFGVTRTLSSPRIMVLNNQQAVLSFATNIVYFTLNISEDSVTSADTSGTSDASIASNKSITSSINTIPIGVILTLQPNINTKSGEIMMNIRPTLSRLSSNAPKEDPAVLLYNSGKSDADKVSSVIPEVEVREIDSVLRVKSGEVMAIGGMIEQRIQNQDSGVPYASEVPLVGNLFKSVAKKTSSVQTVIFLKATIVPGYGTEEKDQQLYDKFTNDPRPMNF